MNNRLLLVLAAFVIIAINSAKIIWAESLWIQQVEQLIETTTLLVISIIAFVFSRSLLRRSNQKIVWSKIVIVGIIGITLAWLVQVVFLLLGESINDVALVFYRLCCASVIGFGFLRGSDSIDKSNKLQ